LDLDVNGNQVSQLAHALNELRPDWPISSLTTWITNNLSKRSYQDAAVALVWVALDIKPDGTFATERPARVLEAGPWWRAAAAGEARVTPGPAKPGVDCPKHPGQEPPPYCGPCNVDSVRAYNDPDPEPPMPAAEALRIAREKARRS
jgi:hypothetical protein